ncbi:MAG: archaemetzincin [Desulfobacteraceae bacterium]|jgi:archaemetzincin|nr:archaemetzincin [Desulfobacteraceae bacterium]
MKKMPVPPSNTLPCSSGSTCTDKNDLCIIISPIGEIDQDICGLVGKKIQSVFGYHTMTLPILSDISFAYDENRKQYHSTPILQKLADNAPANCFKIIGITGLDLFIPILTHVYGEAQLGGKACMISTYRLHDSQETEIYSKINERIVKEVIHELGHTFNLRHCDSSSCIMHYCRAIQDVDMKSDQLCRYCAIMLADELK